MTKRQARFVHNKNRDKMAHRPSVRFLYDVLFVLIKGVIFAQKGPVKKHFSQIPENFSAFI